MHILKYILFALPCVFGITGYFILDPNEFKFLDALYVSVQLYGFEFGFEDVNIFIELARWSALMVTAVWILTAFDKVAKSLSIKFKLLTSKSEMIAIYGENFKTELLINDITDDDFLAHNDFISHNKFINTKKHIIMFDTPEENLKFFSNNINNLQGKEVHILLEDFSSNMLDQNNIDLYPFSFSEFTAQIFWMEQCEYLCKKVYNDNEVVKIVLIGSGIFAEKLLDYAMLLNIFKHDQEIEYHIFGDFSNYKNLHYKLKKVNEKEHNVNGTIYKIYKNDKFIFYNESWQQNIDFINKFQDVIICAESDTLSLNIAYELKTAVYIKNLHIRVQDDNLFDKTTLSNNNVNIFGTYSELCTTKMIIKGDIINAAKKQHEYYCNKYGDGGMPPWKELDNFTRDSNLSSSIFRNHYIKYICKYLFTDHEKAKELKEDDWSKPCDPLIKHLNQEDLHLLGELEHIRWSRFHYLYNWVHGEPEGDKAKNAELRIHKSLVEYIVLKDKEKDKDIKMLTNNYSEQMKQESK